MTWAPPPRRKYLGGWHWDSVRASLDACVAHLPPSAFRDALEVADSRRHDSSAVWRWGLALGCLHRIERPWEYAHALTDSAAIHRPSSGASMELPATELEQQRWRLQQLAWRGDVDA
jgi:hypothetical protein